MKKEIINANSNKSNKNKDKSFSRSSSYTKPIIKCIFENNEKILFDKETFLSIKPSLINNNYFKIQTLKNNSIQIDISNDVSKEDMNLFLDYINYFFNEKDNNKIEFEDNIDKYKIMKILSISDRFKSEEFNIKFINDVILKNKDNDIIIDILHYSYNKLCYYSQKNKEINDKYFDLFYQSLENLSKNVKLVFNNFDKIKTLDKKVIDEIISKTFKNLLYGNTILIEGNKEFSEIKNEYEVKSEQNNNNLQKITIAQFNEMIQFLMKINSKKNFFELLTSEYSFLLSKDSILELKNLPHPSLQVDIHFSDYSFYFQEFPLEMIVNQKKIILIVSYKNEEQSFNINIKLVNKRETEKKNLNSILEIDKISEEKYIENNSCFKIFTFLTHVMITKGPEKVVIATQNNLLSLSDSKTVYNILKISNFDNELRNFLIREPEKEYFSVIVQIKLCYVYSALASYLMHQYDSYYNDPNICKISKQLLILILENKIEKNKNNNNLVISILLWLDDEINIKEDISSILEKIKWEEVEESMIFELIIKYSHIIVGNKKLENKFISAFETKYNNLKIKYILKSLFSAGLKIEYNKIFIQMKKSQKYNNIYQCFNSESKYKNNFFEYDNSSYSKDSISFKEGIQYILNDSKKEKNKIKNYTFNNSINDFNERKLNKLSEINKKEELKNNNRKIHYKIINNSAYDINKTATEHKSLISKFKKINKDKFTNKNSLNKTPIRICNNNLSSINIRQQNPTKININNKNHDQKKKIQKSYIKSMKKALKENQKINKVSINIHNISNINISHNDFSNYKQDNKFVNKYINPSSNSKAFSLTFCSNKNTKEIKNKDNYTKNIPLKLFSTNDTIKYNYINKTTIFNKPNNNNGTTFNSLLSTILKYDKTINKSKEKYDNKKEVKNKSQNKNNIKFKKKFK